MRSEWLHDAIAELATAGPTRLVVVAQPARPQFVLEAKGGFGEAVVEFRNERVLLETCVVRNRWSMAYPFELVRRAAEAMRLASKVSVRGDEEGVLSLQFLVEGEAGEEGGGGSSFVDYRFVPLVDEEEDDEEAGESEEWVDL
jgi:cell cycle checkpoint protein